VEVFGFFVETFDGFVGKLLFGGAGVGVGVVVGEITFSVVRGVVASVVVAVVVAIVVVAAVVVAVEVAAILKHSGNEVVNSVMRKMKFLRTALVCVVIYLSL
jgi:hypothetical protein